jgi:hypothetical protein
MGGILVLATEVDIQRTGATTRPFRPPDSWPIQPITAHVGIETTADVQGERPGGCT